MPIKGRTRLYIMRLALIGSIMSAMLFVWIVASVGDTVNHYNDGSENGWNFFKVVETTR